MKTFSEKLQDALKEPITTNVDIGKELGNKVKEWDKSNTFYGIFPIVGDSMTCDDDKSIPNGSFVFANEVEIDFSNVFSIPIHKPLLIEIKGVMVMKRQFVCKTITFVDDISKRLLFTSYNPNHKERFIPYCEIGRVFEIQKVFKDKKQIELFRKQL